MNLSKLTVTNGGVSPGTYTALFQGLEAVHNEYGDGLKWPFRIVGGEFDGCIVCRTTGIKPSINNVCGDMLCGVSGQPLSAGVEINLAPFVGQKYIIVVQQGKNGGSTRVEGVTKPPQV